MPGHQRDIARHRSQLFGHLPVRDMPGPGVPDRVGEIPVMGHRQHRPPVAPQRLLHDVQGVEVEEVRRLVQQQHPRRAVHHHRQQQPAQLPGRQARAASRPTGPGRTGARPAAARRRRRTPAPATGRNPAPCTAVRSPSEVCGSTATPVPARLGQRAQQRGLARPVAPGDQDPVAAAHLQIHAVQQHPPAAAPRVRSDAASTTSPGPAVVGRERQRQRRPGPRLGDPPHRLHLPAQPPLADLRLLRHLLGDPPQVRRLHPGPHGQLHDPGPAAWSARCPAPSGPGPSPAPRSPAAAAATGGSSPPGRRCSRRPDSPAARRGCRPARRPGSPPRPGTPGRG